MCAALAHSAFAQSWSDVRPWSDNRRALGSCLQWCERRYRALDRDQYLECNADCRSKLPVGGAALSRPAPQVASFAAEYNFGSSLRLANCYQSCQDAHRFDSSRLELQRCAARCPMGLHAESEDSFPSVGFAESGVTSGMATARCIASCQDRFRFGDYADVRRCASRCPGGL